MNGVPPSLARPLILILSAIFTGVAVAGKIAGPLRLEVWNASVSVRTLSRPLIVAALLFLVHAALDRPRQITRIVDSLGRVLIGAIACAGVIGWML